MDEQKEIAFSVIMPTYNRAFCIENAVNSLISQTYQNYELIIVDDGSVDKTEDLLKEKYPQEFENSKFKYVYVTPNKGVCNARNVGLENAQNEWIAYLDTDNKLRPEFLEEFKTAILNNPQSRIFYAQLQTNSGMIVGKPFNYKNLCRRNYIDMGVFVHHKSMVEEYGKFDTNLRRLVDWDLILRYTKNNKPVFVEKVLLDYSDSKDYDRITQKESLSEAYDLILKKHKISEFTFWQKLFSITNRIEGKNFYKIIFVLGLKFKIRNRRRERQNSNGDAVL